MRYTVPMSADRADVRVATVIRLSPATSGLTHAHRRRLAGERNPTVELWCDSQTADHPGGGRRHAEDVQRPEELTELQAQ